VPEGPVVPPRVTATLGPGAVDPEAPVWAGGLIRVVIAAGDVVKRR
jgi:hypothetical protein